MAAKPQPRPPALTYHERQTADRLRHVFAALVGDGADLTARQTALLLWLAAADRPARAGEAAGALEGLPTGTHAPYVNARLLHRRGLVARARAPVPPGGAGGGRFGGARGSDGFRANHMYNIIYIYMTGSEPNIYVILYTYI